jgi:pyridoxine 5-phosphate synthase
MRFLSVNIDHIATLRQARREAVPDPVQAAVMAELGGADGITVHLRSDRRHINERDVRLLIETVKTDVNVEMAATPEMVQIIEGLKPAQVSLVPEFPDEITTQGGLDVVKSFKRLSPAARRLKNAGIALSAFIEPNRKQIASASALGCDLVEFNTDAYSRCGTRKAGSGIPQSTFRNPHCLKEIAVAAGYAARCGLKVHAGHGIDYRNIIPLLGIPEIEGFSIGFSIVARAVLTGLREAVSEMKRIMEVYP